LVISYGCQVCVFKIYIFNIPKIIKKNEIEIATRKTGRVSSEKSEG
jgi:hypothetical protein